MAHDRQQESPEPLDPAELGRAFADVLQQSSQLLTRFATRESSPSIPGAGHAEAVGQAFMEWARKAAANPLTLAQAQNSLWQDHLKLWQTSAWKALGQPADPVVEPKKGDKRFAAEAWTDSFLFEYIKQFYLLTARHIHAAMAGVEDLDPATAKKVDFYTRQYIDAFSPTNFALTNPQVLAETVRTGGMNLLKGLKNLLADLEHGSIRMTDVKTFKLGENLAMTKGQVVYQNELMQLLQYEPTTPVVHKRPLLIVPPWINKYYILDLRDNNSLIKWLVDQGHTTFVISWVNPDEKLAEKNFEDYLADGTLAALDRITEATGEKAVNAIGYCLGGTLLASTLGYLAARGSARIASATFLTTMIDFSEPGELGVFIDEQSVANLEGQMEARGYLEAREMAATFNLLRANDLIWSFFINNYLLGKEPPTFDLLYWNSDSTRMPASMHSFYLRNMYQENLLCVPGAITLKGAPIDITKIDVPAYFLSTAEDHIAPWRSTYAGARLMSGPVRFVLGQAGHTAGVVNPPSTGKYDHWVGSGSDLPEDPDQWFSLAEQQAGSWWNDWRSWIETRSEEKVPADARIPGAGRLKALERAPGSYARLRLDASAA